MMKKVKTDIFLKLMFNIQKNYMNFIVIYHFYLNERNFKQVEKLVTNLYDKAEYVIHTGNLKQALNHGLTLKKNHRWINFSQDEWLWRLLESIEILNLSQRKKKEVLSMRTKLPYYKVFHRTSLHN